MNNRKKEFMNFSEYELLDEEEQLRKLVEFWGFKNNVFFGKLDRRVDDTDAFTYVSSLKNIDGETIYSPFNGEKIDKLFCYTSYIPMKTNILEGDMVAFTVILSNSPKQDKPIKVNEKSIRKLEDFYSVSTNIEENNVEFDKEFINSVNNKFLEENSYFKVYVDKDFKANAIDAIRYVHEEKGKLITEINNLKLQKDVSYQTLENIKLKQEVSIKNAEDKLLSIAENYKDIEKSIIDIQKREKQYIKLGLLEEKKVKKLKDKNKLNNKEKIKHIHNYLSKREENPLLYKEEIIEQFFLGLNTNQIIILGGAPGSGKTSLVEAISNSIGAKCHMISVRPNWNSAEDLLGFYNPVNKLYIGTPMIDAIIEASENPDELFLICLDEMNIGCVEQYFSDLLSALYSEARELKLYSNEIYSGEMKIIDRKFGDLEKEDEIIENIGINEYVELERRFKNLNKYKPQITIPNNIRFIGTINRDATTKDLSPKVIDRSIIININSSFDTFEELIKLKNEEIVSPIFITSDEFNIDDYDLSVAYEYFGDLIKLFNKNGIDLNFRFLKTAATMLNVDGIDKINLYDYVISTKVLPKINLEVNDNDELLTELEKIILTKTISQEIYKDMKEFYNEHDILTYWR